MNEKNIINIPKIHQIIKNKHADFLDNYGLQVEKVIADHQLMTELILSRIYRIVISFQEENIIDNIVMQSTYPLKSIRLMKKGFESYIVITTNGESVVFEGFGYVLGVNSDITLPTVQINDINKENYDWMEFAKLLLDYIHTVIYERQKACETKINTYFRN